MALIRLQSHPSEAIELRSKELLSTSSTTVIHSVTCIQGVEIALKLTPRSFPDEPGQTIWAYKLHATCRNETIIDDQILSDARVQARAISECLVQPSCWNFATMNVEIDRVVADPIAPLDTFQASPTICMKQLTSMSDSDLSTEDDTVGITVAIPPPVALEPRVRLYTNASC